MGEKGKSVTKLKLSIHSITKGDIIKLVKSLSTFSPPVRKRSTAARLMCCFWQSSSSTCLMEAPCRRGMEQLEPSGSITVHVLMHRSLSFSQTEPERLSSHCFTHYKTPRETKTLVCWCAKMLCCLAHVNSLQLI